MMIPFSPQRWATRLAFALVCLAFSATAFAQDAGPPAHRGKLDAVVRGAVDSGQGVRAIVRFRSADDRQRGGNVVVARGGAVGRAHNDVGALTIAADAATIDALAADDGVLSISLDAPVRSSSTPPQRAARSSGARQVRESFNRRGSGITVAVIDSGVAPHADLPRSRIRAFVDFVNGRTEPYDDFGHGTHVAGIIAGTGASSAALESPYVGVAPSVDLVALKVLSATGAGYTSDVIAALEWVAANHQAYNIRAVNLSLGHPVYESAASDPLVQAAQALVRRGIVVVASAGNLGVDPRDGQVAYGGITSPANGPDIIAVGAVDNRGTDARSDDVVAGYSSRGPTRFDLVAKPDLVASGHHTVSLSAPGSSLFENYPALRVVGGTEQIPAYMMLSGTSMAAPVVAGAAALVIETNPRLSAHAVRTVLEFTAQQLPAADVMTQGAGYLNTFGAVRLAALIKPQAPVGAIWLTLHTIPTAADMLFGETVAWSKTVLWGNRVLLGDSAYVHFRAWSDGIVWGENDGIVWGENGGNGQCNNENCDGIVWGEDQLTPVVWAECADVACNSLAWDGDPGEIVWTQNDPGESGSPACNPAENPGCDDDGIVWGENGAALAYWASNTTAGFWSDSVTWSNVRLITGTDQTDSDGDGDDDGIVWGECVGAECDGIVWGENAGIVWGQGIVWGENGDGIVWGESYLVLTDGGR